MIYAFEVRGRRSTVSGYALIACDGFGWRIDEIYVCDRRSRRRATGYRASSLRSALYRTQALEIYDAWLTYYRRKRHRSLDEYLHVKGVA